MTDTTKTPPTGAEKAAARALHWILLANFGHPSCIEHYDTDDVYSREELRWARQILKEAGRVPADPGLHDIQKARVLVRDQVTEAIAKMADRLAISVELMANPPEGAPMTVSVPFSYLLRNNPPAWLFDKEKVSAGSDPWIVS